MASLIGNRTVKLWTCCECKETGISVTLGDCPRCDHPRCIDCDVKSHVALETENEEEWKKTARSATMAEGAARESNESESWGLQEHSRAQDKGGQSGVSTRFPGVVESPAASPRDQQSSTISWALLSKSRAFILRHTLSLHETAPPLPLIPIASGIEQYPVFVLRQYSDADLILEWTLALPVLSNRCLGVRLGHGFDKAQITSLHLFRIGLDEFSSRPTIIVNTSRPLHSDAKKELQAIISTTPARRPFQTDFSNSLQILFRQSQVRRSLDSLSPLLPPICQPRNRLFSQLPGTGASIGIAGSIEDTATLGCYLLVNQVPMVLTVDHLVPKNSDHHLITHISEQDRFEMMLPVLVEEVRSLMRTSDHSCNSCIVLRCSDISDEDAWAFVRYILNAPFDIDRLSCSFFRALATKCQTGERVVPIASQYRQSGTRFRSNGLDKREMDWALFAVVHNSSFEGKQQLLDQHEQCLFGTKEELHLDDEFIPGVLVRSIGRTSGHQSGKISTTMSAVFHGKYVTQEWCVIKRPETPLDEWIEGGIGVEGDSGALIVDQDSGAVYGMLWGRTGDGPATVTIFTPMLEIFKDIQREIGVMDVELLRGQEMPRPDKAEVAETSQEAESVPTTMSLKEKEQETSLEEATSSFYIQQQPSADTRHPHSFERYRGRDASNRSVPRSVVQAPVENTKSSEWPGVHTYLRYAIAPEQE